jgi:hypothetical protein
MKATRTANWTTAKGNQVELTVEISREVSDKIAYADGANISIGKETSDLTNITLKINGKIAARGYSAPHILTKASYFSSYEKLTSAGAYARLGDSYIAEADYNKIMDAYNAAIAEINGSATPEAAEYKTVKTAEIADELSISVKTESHGAGWCNKCQSYCWGDCEAN